MPAIITDSFRRNNTRLFLDDISSNTNRYYLGIGKSDAWSEDEVSSTFVSPTPVGSNGYAHEVLQNCATFKKLSSVSTSMVVPSVPFVSGSVYKQYDSHDNSCFYPSNNVKPCYITNASGQIFLCLKATDTASTEPSTQTNKFSQFSSDGGRYVWVMIQDTLSGGGVIKNSAFTSVRDSVLTNVSGGEQTADLAKSGSGGLISGFKVINSGSGYNNATVAKLTYNNPTDQNNTDITLDVTLSGGVITGVNFNTSTLVNTWPKGAVSASVTITGAGAGAVVLPIMAPSRGYAYQPSAVLPSWYAGLSAQLVDSIEDDNFFTQYRQISIVKNPTTTQSSAGTLNALRALQLDSNAPSNLSGKKIYLTTGSGDEFVAHVDHYAPSTKLLYFHQNTVSGYRELPLTGTIKIDDQPTAYSYSSIVSAEYTNDDSAQVLFVENRSPINRNSGQTEDLILIIQF